MTPIPILLYHSVGHTRSPTYRRWCVEPSLFREHVDAVFGAGYEPLTVSQLVDAMDHDEVPTRPIVLTFDDGLADFVEHAAPVLGDRGIVSTMYVVSGHVGGSSQWLSIAGESQRPMMTWSDLTDIAHAGHEIGAHTRTHPELDVLRRDHARAEIEESRAEIEAGTGRAVRSFAYPHGYHSGATVQATGAAGFDSACAVKNRWSWVGERRDALSRIVVDGHTPPEQLVHRLARPPATPERQPHLRRLGWRQLRRIQRVRAIRAS
ncbi:MAG: polysaccharide deacetylase family protein [Actinomycetia bacterium]|nr:polysaccharide deacetylase family protein [Actinomycetes bacterium]